jgi:hypothetical protein
MKLGCTLLCFIFMSAVALAASSETRVNASELHFRSCLKQSMRKNSPPERDDSKLICLEKFVGVTLSSCLGEAKKLEYLTNSEEAYKTCYYSRPQVWNTRNCLDVAKKLHTFIDRDGMRLDCFSQLESQQTSRKNCLMVAVSFEQLHYRERFKQVCQEN